MANPGKHIKKWEIEPEQWPVPQRPQEEPVTSPEQQPYIPEEVPSERVR